MITEFIEAIHEIPYFKKLWLYKRRGLSIGSNCVFHRTVSICFPENVTLGDNVRVNEGVYIGAGYGKVVIGNDVTLSPYVKIVNAGYDVDLFMQDERHHIEDKNTYIGNNVWVCMGAIICPGVKISGNHVIIAAGAVVNKSFDESYVLLAGNPARIVKRYKKCEEEIDK